MLHSFVQPTFGGSEKTPACNRMFKNTESIAPCQSMLRNTSETFNRKGVHPILTVGNRPTATCINPCHKHWDSRRVHFCGKITSTARFAIFGDESGFSFNPDILKLKRCVHTSLRPLVGWRKRKPAIVQRYGKSSKKNTIWWMVKKKVL